MVGTLEVITRRDRRWDIFGSGAESALDAEDRDGRLELSPAGRIEAELSDPVGVLVTGSHRDSENPGHWTPIKRKGLDHDVESGKKGA
jgi:hypothetical protein